MLQQPQFRTPLTTTAAAAAAAIESAALDRMPERRPLYPVLRAAGWVAFWLSADYSPLGRPVARGRGVSRVVAATARLLAMAGG